MTKELLEIRLRSAVYGVLFGLADARDMAGGGWVSVHFRSEVVSEHGPIWIELRTNPVRKDQFIIDPYYEERYHLFGDGS